MWQTKCRNFQRINKELQAKLKQKDAMILTLSDQNKHLIQLSKDKNLQERAFLAERVKELEQRCAEKENELKLYARRLQMEAKAYRTNVNLEQQKYRDLLMKIEMSDLLMNKRNEKKVSNKVPPKINVHKLTPTRNISKSASNLSNVAEEKSELLQLPPCVTNNNDSNVNDSPVKRSDEKLSNKNTTVIYAASDITNITNCENDEKEKKCETNEHDDIHSGGDLNAKNENEKNSSTQKNATRGRQFNRGAATTKISNNITKLTPLNTTQKSIDEKDEKKSQSDDSEFSDDNNFHLFSDHNGTMVMISPIAVRESDNCLGLYMNPFSWKYA
jgi:hypothetical protein